jgi:hypothetical protein
MMSVSPAMSAQPSHRHRPAGSASAEHHHLLACQGGILLKGADHPLAVVVVADQAAGFDRDGVVGPIPRPSASIASSSDSTATPVWHRDPHAGIAQRDQGLHRSLAVGL